MTSNIWINYIMSDIPEFMGTFSINNIPSPKSFPCYMIVNFSTLNSPGSHFVTIMFLSNIDCLYFDPLNLTFIPEHIINYMHKNTENIFKINYTIQNPLSVFCGFYCLLPIMLHVNKLSIINGISVFYNSSIKNDDICVKMLTNLFKLYYLENLY